MRGCIPQGVFASFARYYLLLVGVGILLLWSGAEKVLSPFTFLRAVQGYRIVTDSAAMQVTIVLPWIEVITALCLLSGLLLHGAIIIATGLGILFAAATTIALAKGLDIPCGCFGLNGETVGAFAFVRAVLLAAVSAGAYAAIRRLGVQPSREAAVQTCA